MKRRRSSTRPWFKRWWFWVLAIVVAGNLLTGGVDDNSEKSVPDTLSQNESIDTNEEPPVLDEVVETSQEKPIKNLDEEDSKAEEKEEDRKPTIKNPLKIHYLDVGQADATFIELPNGETMLIDAGEAKSSNQILRYIKELGYSSVNYVVATHPHADHIGGMEGIINSIDIDQFYMPDVAHTTLTFEGMIDALTLRDVDTYQAKAGTEIINFDKLNVSILSPQSSNYSNLNNWSAVVRIKYNVNSFLFMGDAEVEVEDELNDVSATVLKVGHHGSDTSSGSAFLEKVKPVYSIISVGKENKYGHPSSQVLENLDKVGSKVYRTDLLGTIIVESDGIKVDVNQEPNRFVKEEPTIVEKTPEPILPSTTEAQSEPKESAPIVETQPKESTSTTPPKENTPPKVEEPSIGTEVFITKTGTKYHRAGCQYLKKSKIPISLSEAKGSYEPCKKM